MHKINIVGTSGIGKSTLAKQLAKRLNFPLIEMDALFWRPNWQHLNDDEFNVAIEQAINKPNWVLDGNYNRTVPVKWKEVDTVIWLDYSFTRTFYQAIKRAMTRIITHKELWPNTGNRETFKRTFLSKESILLWTIMTHKTNKARYTKMMSSEHYKHINFIRLQSPAETSMFLQNIKTN